MSTEVKNGRGRPKGSVNNMASYLKKVEGTVEFFRTLQAKVAGWAQAEAEESEDRDVLTGMANMLTDFVDDVSENLVTPMNGLVGSDWKPTKVVIASTTESTYTTGRQVWLKEDRKPEYVEMGFDSKYLDELFVVNTVKGKIVVSAGKNGKVRIPMPKAHLTVTNPEAVV